MSSLDLDQQRALDRLKEPLVQAAETWLDEGRAVDCLGKQFGHSQFRNLIAVANETESPAVVLNLIRYQMGRDPRGQNWGFQHGGKSLGERLIDDLSADGGVVEQQLRNVPRLEGQALLRQLARMAMIRHYLGFASRYLKYLELQNHEPRRGAA